MSIEPSMVTMNVRYGMNKLIAVIRSLNLIQSPTLWGRYQSDARILATWLNLTSAELLEIQQRPELLNESRSSRVANWYLPPFKYAYFGGVMTILRLAAFLRTTMGISSRFLIVGVGDTKQISKQIEEAFPTLSGSQVLSAPDLNDIANVPSADYSFATFWTTAYYVQKIKNTALKFYVVQDFEPLFYPAGSTYAQVEETYKFGFYGICNTETIRKKYEQYGSIAEVIIPAVDRSVFYPKERKHENTKSLFFYARPDTPRNMFELVAPALIKAKRALGDELQITCAGGDWRPEDYGLKGIVEVKGLLTYEQTGELYRQSDIGLAFMMTPHPSYLPLELMASGTLVIANENQDNQWLLRDKVNCLTTRATVSSISDKIIEAVRNFDTFADIRAESIRTIDENHSSWEESLSRVQKFIADLG